MASKHSCNNTVIFAKFLGQEVDVKDITSLKEAYIKVNTRLPQMILLKHKNSKVLTVLLKFYKKGKEFMTDHRFYKLHISYI